MVEFFSTWKPFRRRSRRAPRRNRPWILEDLEGRRLLSETIQPLVTLPAASSNMISGPGGDLWVAVSPRYNVAAIERIGLNGSVTTFPVPGENEAMGIEDLTVGPDGNVWFDIDFQNVDVGGGQLVIGNITPTGVVTEYPPIAGAGVVGGVTSLVSGPGGDLWFVCSLQHQNEIGRVTTDGDITLFPITFRSKTPLDVYSLAAGPDGNLWFAEGWGKHFQLGRMSPSGAVTWFPIPGHVDGATVENGANGSIILTGGIHKRNVVFQVSTTGAVTQDNVPASLSKAFNTYLGSADGSLWFAEAFGASEIGQITASGVATSQNLSSSIPGRGRVISIVVGPDNDIYVLDSALDLPSRTSTVYRIFPS